ncbi:MAG: dUTP diphosphatase [Candidatus Saccharimonadales bacterium]
MKIRVTKLRDDAVLPEYQTAGAAAADIHACLDEPVTLQPMERRMILTGLAMAIPGGYEVQIRARSGLSIKYGIAMVNGVGTIDSDYRGEVGVLVINLGQDAFTIEPGMRIAQMVLGAYEQIAWQQVDSLDETVRGAGGYGSTGVAQMKGTV